MQLKKFSLIFLLACCFAPSFLFMKVSVAELPPLTVVTLRVLVAALIMLTIIKIKGKSLKIFRSHFRHFFVSGTVGTLIPFFLITQSEKTISSALAGLINGSVPIFTVLFAHFFIPNDKLNRRKAIGTLLGVAGLACIFVPSINDGAGSAIGVSMVIAASLCYGISMVYSKTFLHDLPPLIAPTCQLTVASLVAIPFCLILDKPYALPFPSQATVYSVLGLAVIGGVFAYILFFKILRIAEASELSFTTLLFPLLAIFLGVTFLHERLTWNVCFGGVLILLGLVVATEMFARNHLPRRYRKENAG